MAENLTNSLEETIKRAQRGDREAFSRLLDDHYALMYRFAFKYCGQRADAEDVTQQACVKLARVLPQFRFQSAFTTWLYRLVINCALDWHRRQPATGDPELAEPVVDSNAEPAVMLRQVLTRVQAMGEGYCETLVLVHGEGLTHAEAAAVLELKESTVSWRLHEIRKRLQHEQQPGVEV